MELLVGLKFSGWGLLLLALGCSALTVAGPCGTPEDLEAVRFEQRTFTSPNYPQKYPDNSDCVWRITAKQKDDIIQITTLDMQVEQQFGAEGCFYDYLQAFDGYSSENVKLGQWCGNKKSTLVSSGPSMTVVFQSDGSYRSKGFRIAYIAGTPGSFESNYEPGGGISMIAMVGYMVLILAILSVAMIMLRVALARSKWCQHIGGPSGRGLFRRRPNGTNGVSRQSSTRAPEVFTVPVPPPPYQEEDGFPDTAPPPYAELPPTVSLDIVEVENSSPENSNNSFEVAPVTYLPPSYSSLMLENDSLSCVSCEDNTSVNTDSTNEHCI